MLTRCKRRTGGVACRSMSKEKPTLRHARPEDARAIIALQKSIYREGRWFVGDAPLSVDALLRRLRSLDNDATLYLIAARGTEVDGWLELHRLTPRRLRHVAMLTIAVASPARGQGLGTRLLTASYGWARRVGVEKIALNVRASNTAAIALYERQGFVFEGCEARQIREGDRFEDNFLMAKFL